MDERTSGAESKSLCPVVSLGLSVDRILLANGDGRYARDTLARRPSCFYDLVGKSTLHLFTVCT
jgi:hypothetical protein